MTAITNIQIFIIFYFIIGVILQIKGPIAIALSRKFKTLKISSSVEVLLGNKPTTNIKFVLINLTIRIITSIIYPLLLIIVAIDTIRNNNTVNEDEKYFNKKKLYFSNISGTGKIKCNNCEFNEKIVGTLRGSTDYNYLIGFQCQKCGKFNWTYNDEKDNLICECGGVLDREQVVFCPNCKSRNMKYKVEYIT